MMLRYTCFQVFPAFCNSFLVIFATNWFMTWVPICIRTLFPYLRYETTKNNMSSLYWGKSDIVRLASTYSFYGIETAPSSWDATHPHQVPQWKDLQPHFCTESLSEGRDLGPSIHQCHHLHPLYHNLSLICMSYYAYQGIRVVKPRFCHKFASIYQHP